MSIEAVNQADRLYRAKDRLSRQQLVDEVVSQAEWGVWGNKHLATLSGLRPAFVSELTGKPDRTSGSMNPDRLGSVAQLIGAKNRGEDVKEYAIGLLEDGFTTTLLARLTGIPQSTLARWSK